jgi:energy-coupling factor transporter ATP-binding protein EcfA2
MSGDAAAAPSAVTVALAPSGAGVGSQVELRGMAAAGGSSKGSLVSQHSASTVTAPEASEPAPEKHPEAPLVEVRFENVSYHVDIPARADTGDNFPTVPKALAQIATLPVKLIRNLAHGRIIAPPRRVDILKDVSGVLRPGTLTLVTCPPGHGRSSYLRMCAKQLPADNVSGGAVTFSGSEDGKEAGCHLGQLVQYVNQLDEHLPYLTVKETLEFVHKNSVVDPAEFPGYEHLAGKHGQQVEDIKKLLNLGNCWNTIIGNQSLRGVSGGEKKRVTDAEGLLTSAQAILLDE